MNIKDISTMIMGFIVATLVVVTILTPIVSVAIEDQHIYYNNSNGQYSSIVGEDNLVLSFSYDEELKPIYTVNGDPVTLDGASVLTSDLTMFRWVSASQINNYLRYVNNGTYTNEINILSFNAVIDNGQITITYVKSDSSTKSVTIPYAWGFYATNTGDYRAMWTPFTVYFKDTTEIYSVGTFGSNNFYSSKGTDIFCLNVDSATIGYDYQLANGVIDVYTFNQTNTSGGMTVTLDRGGELSTYYPRMAIVPAEVIGDKSTFSDSLDTLLSIIPIFAVLGIVIGIIVLYRRT